MILRQCLIGTWLFKQYHQCRSKSQPKKPPQSLRAIRQHHWALHRSKTKPSKMHRTYPQILLRPEYQLLEQAFDSSLIEKAWELVALLAHGNMRTSNIRGFCTS